MTTGYSTADVKSRLSEMLGRVRHGKERLLVLRRGKPVAALVSVDDLHRLEALDREQSASASISGHPIMRAAGGWDDYVGVDELLTEVYAARENTGREVEL